MADQQSKIDAYRAAVTSCVLCAQLLATLDLPAFLAAIERAESVGAILDPTLYREKVDAMLEDKAVLQAAMPLYRLGVKLEELRAAKAQVADG